MPAIHAANFSGAIDRASDEAGLKAAAAKHAPYLLGADAARLREKYAARLGALRGLKP